MDRIHKKWYNRVIEMGHVGHLPDRNEFLETDLDEKIKNTISDKEDFMFFPSSTHELSLWNDSNKRLEYVLVLFGIVESGRKTIIVIEDIRPYFAVRIPKDKRDEPENFKEFIVAKLSENISRRPETAKVHRAKRYLGYEEDQYPYIYMEFATLKQRKEAFKCILEMGLETGWDDTRDYHRVVSRDAKLSLTQWLIVSNYKKKNNAYFKIDTIHVQIEDLKNYEGKLNRISLLKDKTLMAYWDIETYSKDHSLPKWDDKRSQMFQISLVFCWLHDSAPLMQYLITTKPSYPSKSYTTIICLDESEMILVMGKILELMMPEFWVAFNCGIYDFPWVIERAKKYNVFREFNDLCNIMTPRKKCSQEEAAKWSCFTEHVKIEADTSAIENTFRVPGTLSFDLCNMYRQLYPNDGFWSLDYFLKKSSLPPKNEMKPIQIFETFEKMDEIQKHPLYKSVLKLEKKHRSKREEYSNSVLLEPYEDNDEVIKHKECTAEELYEDYKKVRELMKEIAEYCIIDSFRCHQLLRKRDIIGSKRIMAHISYTSMYDAVYRAGGVKSRNRLVGTAKERNLIASNAKKNSKTDNKYPGAYVFNPVPGFRSSRLTPRERIEKYRSYKNDMEKYPSRYEDCVAQERQRPPYREWRHVKEEEIIKVEEHIYNEKINCVKMSKTDAEKLVMDVLGDVRDDVKTAFVEYLMEDTNYPITGLDFNALYPSICMTYNLSGEMIISADDYGSVREAQMVAIRLKQKGYNIHKIEFPYGNSTVLAWCILHDNKPEMLGVFPTVYVELTALRNKYKVPAGYCAFVEEYMNYFKKENISLYELILVIRMKFSKKTTLNVQEILESLEIYPPIDEIKSIEDRCNRFTIDPKYVMNFLGLKLNPKYIHDGSYIPPEIEKSEFDTILPTSEIEFYSNHFTTKQLQVKVYMNTFYGESGNQISPLYKKEIAGGITTGGVYAIKFAAEVVKKHGCGIVYGDTDSLYIYADPNYFRDINLLYFTGRMQKLDYWTKMVTITNNQIKQVQDIVNKELKIDNGTEFLKMAYEEVLWCYFLSRKKKYGGVKHQELIEFNVKDIKKLFLRGLDVRKRGTSVLTIQATENILLTAIKPTNLLTWRELTLNEIDRIYENFNEGKLDITQFIKSAKYKPVNAIQRMEGKGNKSVLTFADRMRARGIPLTPHARFDFVIALGQQYKYDYRGRKRDLSTGERMETVEYVKEHKIPVDIHYYMLNYICGQLSQFVSYHPDFYKAPKNETNEEVKKAADNTNKAAKKFLIAHCKRYMTKYINRGPLVRVIFKYVKEQSEEILASLGLSDWAELLFVDWAVGTSNKFRKSFIDIVEKKSNKEVEDVSKIIKRKIKKHGSKYLYVMYRDYVTSPKSLEKQAVAKYYSRQDKYLSLLNSKVNTIMSTIHKNMEIIEKSNLEMRKIPCIAEFFDSPTKENPKEKDIETLLSKYLDEDEVDDVLSVFNKKLKKIIVEFVEDEYYRDGFKLLQTIHNKMIHARKKLITIQNMAKEITRKVQKDNKVIVVEDNEIEYMVDKICNMSDVTDSDEELNKMRTIKEKKIEPMDVESEDSEVYDSDGEGVLILDDTDEEDRALPLDD